MTKAHVYAGAIWLAVTSGACTPSASKPGLQQQLGSIPPIAAPSVREPEHDPAIATVSPEVFRPDPRATDLLLRILDEPSNPAHLDAMTEFYAGVLQPVVDILDVDSLVDPTDMRPGWGLPPADIEGVGRDEIDRIDLAARDLEDGDVRVALTWRLDALSEFLERQGPSHFVAAEWAGVAVLLVAIDPRLVSCEALELAIRLRAATLRGALPFDRRPRAIASGYRELASAFSVLGAAEHAVHAAELGLVVLSRDTEEELPAERESIASQLRETLARARAGSHSPLRCVGGSAAR